MAKIANIKKIDLYRLAEVGRTIPKTLPPHIITQ